MQRKMCQKKSWHMAIKCLEKMAGVAGSGAVFHLTVTREVSIVVWPVWHLPIAAVLVTSVPRTGPNHCPSPLNVSYLERCGWE